MLLSDIHVHLHTLPVLSALAATALLGFRETKKHSPLFLLLKWTLWHLGSLRAHKEVEEKLFLIVINIQKKQTICFQITGMPSLSFLHNVSTWRISGGTFWQTSEVALTPSSRIVPAFPNNEKETRSVTFEKTKKQMGWMASSNGGKNQVKIFKALEINHGRESALNRELNKARLLAEAFFFYLINEKKLRI